MPSNRLNPNAGLPDKGFGPGPWNDEPDEAIWDDAATGLCCVATRHRLFGVWRGYVCVPSNHELHGKRPRTILVHGGLNYIGPACQDIRIEKPGYWWYGFDCGHGGDLVPGTRMLFKMAVELECDTLFKMLKKLEEYETYRTLAYVREQCASLAAQLAAIVEKLRHQPK